MKAGLLRCFFVLSAFFWSVGLQAQETSPADTFPVPNKSQNQLFYLQRQPNANTIVVDLNVKNGKLDVENPVHVYWLRYTENGQKAELNWIQKTFAYGIHSNKIREGLYELNFVSYKKMKFYLERGTNNVWKVFANPGDGSRMILRSIYIHVNGGSFWKPNVEYVELKGIDAATQKEEREKIHLKY